MSIFNRIKEKISLQQDEHGYYKQSAKSSRVMGIYTLYWKAMPEDDIYYDELVVPYDIQHTIVDNKDVYKYFTDEAVYTYENGYFIKELVYGSCKQIHLPFSFMLVGARHGVEEIQENFSKFTNFKNTSYAYFYYLTKSTKTIAEKLSTIINIHDIDTKKLAKHCHMRQSRLQEIVNGTKLPKSSNEDALLFAEVLKMCNFED